MWMWIFNILLLVSMDHKFNGPLSHRQIQKNWTKEDICVCMHVYAIHSPKYFVIYMENKSRTWHEIYIL